MKRDSYKLTWRNYALRSNFKYISTLTLKNANSTFTLSGEIWPILFPRFIYDGSRPITSPNLVTISTFLQRNEIRGILNPLLF